MEHDKTIVIGLAGVFLLGVGAQWLAWRLRVPAILLLLIFGLIAGPGTRLIVPDEIFGQLLLPLVSLSVAIILFEGGLTLRIGELRSVGRAVRNLVTFGVLITWAIGSLAAWWLLDMAPPIALLVGAILTVTGPTVIAPLLRHVRPIGKVASALKWEGIIIDPVGALLAVLVFEFVVAAANGEVESAVSHALFGIAKTLVLGGGIGGAVALLLAVLFQRHWVPDFLQAAFAFMIVLVTFVICNALQSEAGLLAVTVMGIVLSNQSFSSVRHISEFKENLQVLLISSLFILLAARLEPDQLTDLGWGGLAFVGILVLIARPLAAWISTLGSDWDWRQRVVLAWVAPRGIVAAAVAAVFALEMEQKFGVAEAGQLVPVTFLTIILTVAIYGLTAGPLARWLGVADPSPQGVLIVGAHRWARQLAAILKEHDVRVLLVDSNRFHTNTARMEGLPAYNGSILSDRVQEDLDLAGIGKLFALTPNDSVNALAAHAFKHTFSAKNVYQLVGAPAEEGETTRHVRGRTLFGEEVNYDYLTNRFERGSVIKATPLTEKFDFDAFRDRYGENALPLFTLSDSGQLTVLTDRDAPRPRAGQTLISLVDGEPEDRPRRDSESAAADEARTVTPPSPS